MMCNVPEVIYLQWYGEDGEELCAEIHAGDVTWCADQIFESDIKYVRADSLPAAPEQDWERVPDCTKIPCACNEEECTNYLWYEDGHIEIEDNDGLLMTIELPDDVWLVRRRPETD